MTAQEWRKGRHRARIAAFQALFSLESRRASAETALEHAFETTEVEPAHQGYARRLVEGVLHAQPDLDALIQASASAWPVGQLARVDRTVLRLAMYEMLHEPSVPIKAAIDEAVELAKEYGGDSSPRFVNGVLGTIAAGLLARDRVAHDEGYENQHPAR